MRKGIDWVGYLELGRVGARLYVFEPEMKAMAEMFVQPNGANKGVGGGRAEGMDQV